LYQLSGLKPPTTNSDKLLGLCQFPQLINIGRSIAGTNTVLFQRRVPTEVDFCNTAEVGIFSDVVFPPSEIPHGIPEKIPVLHRNETRKVKVHKYK
jgi:hypothetical protein